MAAGLTAALALGAAITRVWWLAALAAGVAAALAVLVRFPKSARRADVPPRVDAPVALKPPERVSTPLTAEPDDVVRALAREASRMTRAASAHLWLQDPATATFRLVSAAGERLPSRAPLGFADPSVADVLAHGEASLSSVMTMHDAGSEVTLWRFAFPVVGTPADGLACIDVASASPPDRAALEQVASAFQPALATALALHVARGEAAAAANLLEAAHELARRLSEDEVLERGLERAVTLSDAATGSIMLTSEDGGGLRIAAARGLPVEIVESTVVSPGEGIAGWVYSSGKPLLVEDLPTKAGSRRRGVRSSVSVPLGDEDGVLGVLNVGSQEFPARFTDAHLHAMEVLARQIAVALRNARAMESATDLYFATLTALSVALETKDPYARGATGRIVEIVRAIADRMGLAPVERQALNVAALLHDIGMGVAGGPIGGSARPLSTVERGLLKAHPVVAAEILADVPAMREVVPIVYHHHEWFDGHGYVGGLAGESIPLGARILAVADAFVAMTSDRPYRRAMSVPGAVDELTGKSGSQFDPEVVAALRDALEADPDLALTALPG